MYKKKDASSNNTGYFLNSVGFYLIETNGTFIISHMLLNMPSDLSGSSANSSTILRAQLRGGLGVCFGVVLRTRQ